MVMICEKLSSGVGTRCYYEDTYKICKEGWVKMESGEGIVPTEVEIPVYSDVPQSAEGIKWECSPEGCVRIK